MHAIAVLCGKFRGRHDQLRIAPHPSPAKAPVTVPLFAPMTRSATTLMEA
jgi:hypothetical protein